jgi:hypothetical protein
MRELREHAVAQVASSIRDGVFRMAPWHYGPGLTQPVIEMSARDIPWRLKATSA